VEVLTARFIDVEPAREPVDTSGNLVWLLAVAAFVAAAFLSVHAVNPSVADVAANNDFAAYYCAGTVARAGGDPYASLPLERCSGGAGNPAPLPPYAVALFSLASVPGWLPRYRIGQPYRIAVIDWEFILLFAVLATVWATWRTSGYPLYAVAAAVVGTDLVAGLTFGQISILTALGVALTAYFLQRNQHAAAAGVSALALVQPLIGVPLVLSLLLWSRGRWVVLGMLAALGLLAYLVVGPHASLEYAQRALPTYAASETPLRYQYGLTWFAYFFRLDEGRALVLGVAQYWLTVLVAVSIAPLVARRFNSPAMLAALPAAAAVFGGPSVHLSDLASAVPLAALVAGSRLQLAGLGRAALVLLAVPWIALSTVEQAIVGGIAGAIAGFYALGDRPLRVRAIAGAAVLVTTLIYPRMLAALPNASVRPPPMPLTFAARRYDPALAATQHGLALRSQSDVTATTWETLALKLPDWAGLALLYAAGLAALPLGRRSPSPGRPVAFPGFPVLNEENYSLITR